MPTHAASVTTANPPPTGTEPALVVEELSKRYGSTVAIDRVSFSVAPGEVFGLLGPNGAGKTTTLRIIAGLERPDAGTVRVVGRSVRDERRAAQAALGIVPQEIALYDELTARQNLEYFASLRDLRGGERRAQVERALHFVELDEAAGRRTAVLSGGMKRRLNIAVGLLGSPKVLLLDEPTVGIDAQSRRHLLDAIRRLADEGMAVVYSSHYMEEVERLCRRLVVLDRGRVIAQGPLDEVRALAGDRVVFSVPIAPDGAADVEAVVASVRSTFDATAAVRDGLLEVHLSEGSGNASDLIAVLQDAGVPLGGMRVEAPNLETVFLSLTGKALRDAGRGPS